MSDRSSTRRRPLIDADIRRGLSIVLTRLYPLLTESDYPRRRPCEFDAEEWNANDLYEALIFISRFNQYYDERIAP